MTPKNGRRRREGGTTERTGPSRSGGGGGVTSSQSSFLLVQENVVSHQARFGGAGGGTYFSIVWRVGAVLLASTTRNAFSSFAQKNHVQETHKKSNKAVEIGQPKSSKSMTMLQMLRLFRRPLDQTFARLATARLSGHRHIPMSLLFAVQYNSCGRPVGEKNEVKSRKAGWAFRYENQEKLTDS